jgi:hypothetical protein
MRDSLKTKQSKNPDSARALAVSALAYIAADEDRLNRFLGLTGLGPDSLRTTAADPAFAEFMLDYLASDEDLVVAFAADAGIKPEAVAQAREALSRPTYDDL